jgi:SM-20-related protein
MTAMTMTALAAPAVERVCGAIVDDSYAIEADFLPSPLVAALAEEVRRRDATGEFRPAGIGRGGQRVARSDIRGDRILWLEESTRVAAERTALDALETLRKALNRAAYLGLFAFEGHYAVYPPGAFYRRHRDRFRDDDARVVSCALYLNATWRDADGGALRIYLDRGTCDVPPLGGTLVCFLAERYEHEVLPATRERLALTGWFRRRS